MSDPFFQEWTTVFRNENLGLRLRKVNDLPVVQELVPTRFGFPGDAEKGGVPLAAVIVAVNKEFTHARGYDGTVSRIKAAGRPVTLAFRQLHAVEDIGAPRRFWQGTLRLKVAPHVWTGRFYVLREDGSLLSYPSKDIENHSPVDRANVAESTVVHGDLLRSFAGKLLADEATGSGGDALWGQAFAILLEDQLLFFRADSTDAKLDWISALAVLYTAHELGLVSGATPSARRVSWKPSCRDGHSQSPPRTTNSGAAAGGGVGGGGNGGGSSGGNAASVDGGSRRNFPDVRPVAAVAGRTVAVGSQPAVFANRVKQGYLWKRGGSKLWEESRVNIPKRLQAWSQCWFVLLDDGRLLWHKQLPADSSEVPNGQLALPSVVVSLEEADMAPHLREDELRGAGGSPAFPFLLRTGTRLLFLRARSEQERSEWASAIAAVADPQGRSLYPHLAEDLRGSRMRTLQQLTEHPELIFADPETAYGLVVGGRAAGDVGGAVRRDEFVAVAGQHFIPLCDAYTADLVFDALCRAPDASGGGGGLGGGGGGPSGGGGIAGGLDGGALGLVGLGGAGSGGGAGGGGISGIGGTASAAGSGVGGLAGGMSLAGGVGAAGGAGLDYLSELLSEVTGSGDDTRTRTVRAEPLLGGARLTFDVFSKYVRGIQALVAGPDSWDDLRQRLALDPYEVLVRWEEGVSERSQMVPGLGFADTGTLFLTDRHCFLHLSLRSQVRVIPLSGVKEVREVASRAGLVTWHDAIELIGCRVHTVLLTPSSSALPPGLRSIGGVGGGSNGIDEAARERARTQATDYRLVFNKVKDLLSKPSEWQFGRRKAWLDVLREITEAHKLSMALLRGAAAGGGGGGGGGADLSAEAGGSFSPGAPHGGAAVAGLVAGATTGGTATAAAAIIATVSPGIGGSSVAGGESDPTGVLPPVEPGGGSGEDSAAMLAAALLAGDGGIGGGGGGGGIATAARGMARSGKLGRLKAKIRLLMQEEEAGAEAYQVQQDRLHLWVAANMIRARAVQRAASAAAMPRALFFCSTPQSARSRAVLRAFLMEDDGTSAPVPAPTPPSAAVAAAAVAGGGGGVSTGEATSGAMRNRAHSVMMTSASAVTQSAAVGAAGSGASAGGTSNASEAGPGSGTGEEAGGPRPTKTGSTLTLPPVANGGASSAAAAASATVAAGLAGDGGSSAASTAAVFSGGGGGPERPYDMGYRRWLFVLVTCMARTSDYHRRRAQATNSFTPNKFRSEWECFWDAVDPIVDGLENAAKFVLRWESPLLSVCTMWALLAVAYHDLVGYFISMCLFVNVVFIAVRGAAAANAARMAAAAATRAERPARRRGDRGSIFMPPPSLHLVAGGGGGVGGTLAAVAAAASAAATAAAGMGTSPRPAGRGFGALNGFVGSVSGGGGRGTGSFRKESSAGKWLRRQQPQSQRQLGGADDASAATAGPVSADHRAPAGGTATVSPSGADPLSSEGEAFFDEDSDDSGALDEEPAAVAAATTAAAATALEEQEDDEWGADGMDAGGSSLEGEDLDGGEAPKQVRQQESIFKRVKLMQEKAGRMQAKLHMYNTFLLKITSLHNWTDPTRTKIWLALVTLLAVVLATVPSRYLWAAAVIYLFTDPIRPPDKVLPELLWEDFWRGLPVESSTHLNLQMAAIYREQKKEKEA